MSGQEALADWQLPGVALPGSHPHLLARLQAPAAHLNIVEALGQWREQRLTLICTPSDVTERGLWLAKAVRGAWGYPLQAYGQEAARFLPEEALPSAYEVFFSHHVMVHKQRVPLPYSLRLFDEGRQMRLEVSLFGFAARWRDTALECLVAGLSNGVSVRGGDKAERHPWQVEDWWWQAVSPPDLRQQSRFYLVPETPIRFGGGARVKLDAASIVRLLVGRVALMLRWQGIMLAHSEAEVENWAQGLRISPMRPEGDVQFEDLQRRSANTAHFRFLLDGVKRPLELEGVGENLQAALLLGARIGIGAHTSFGFGRYSI